MRFSSASSITSILPSPYQKRFTIVDVKRPKRHPLTLEPFGMSAIAVALSILLFTILRFTIFVWPLFTFHAFTI